MNIYVDIDQTISSGFIGKSVEDSLAYYRARQVEVPLDARHYKDFFGLPEIIRIHEEIPGALFALQHLARTGHEIGYFTVRHSDDPVQQKQIRANTMLWLVEHGFPFAEHVSFFAGMPAKLYEIGKHISKEVLPAIMIDDSWKKVLDAYERIQHVDPCIAQILVERLTLLAFGAKQSTLPTQTPIKLIALPDWTDENIKEIFYAIDPSPRVSAF